MEECDHPWTRWLDCIECEEADEVCQEIICTECGESVEGKEAFDKLID